MGKHRDRRNEANAKHYAAVSASKVELLNEEPLKVIFNIRDYDLEQRAKTAHEVNRAFCESMGDMTRPIWSEAPEWQKESVFDSVRFSLDNPNASPCESHANWLLEMKKEGWKFGEVKDEEKKEHPNFRPYEELSESQRTKIYLFIRVVRSFIIMQKTGE